MWLVLGQRVSEPIVRREHPSYATCWSLRAYDNCPRQQDRFTLDIYPLVICTIDRS
jgi:hypothetical protein